MVLSLHPFRVPWVVLSLHPLRCILKVFVKGTLFLLVLLPWMVLSLHPLRLPWVVLSLHPLCCILEVFMKGTMVLHVLWLQMVLSHHLLRNLLGALYFLWIGLFPVPHYFKPVALCLWALTL